MFTGHTTSKIVFHWESLLYLTASRPDIMLAVGLVARYQAEPKQNHRLVVKRILRYLQGTAQYRL